MPNSISTPIASQPVASVAFGPQSHLACHDSISSERIGFLVSKGIVPEIAAINLEMVKIKLADGDEGLGWSKEQCEEGEMAYKRFLHLCKIHGKGIVPTRATDLFWHCHILDSKSYCAMCNSIFGGYMHHYPYFGMRGEEDARDLEDSFMNTKSLYEQCFSESMDAAESTDCWHDCEGRCWNACSNVSPTVQPDVVVPEQLSGNVSSCGNPLVYPEPISSEMMEFLAANGIAPEIAALDLEMVKMKLMDEDEGLGWSKEQCEEGEMAYKRFLHLCKVRGEDTMPTSKVADSFWCYHILDSRSYSAMCDSIFNGYMHRNL